MDRVFILLAFFTGLVGAPFMVARLWPTRTSFSGDAAAGQSGVSPVFWGSALGASVGYLAIAGLMTFDPESGLNLVDRAQIVAALFGMLALLIWPLIICGFHTWRWDSDGLEFQGVFRRQRLRWDEIVSVSRNMEGWSLRTAAGAKMSSSTFVAGNHLIVGALAHYRGDLALPGGSSSARSIR